MLKMSRKHVHSNRTRTMIILSTNQKCNTILFVVMLIMIVNNSNNTRLKLSMVNACVDVLLEIIANRTDSSKPDRGKLHARKRKLTQHLTPRKRITVSWEMSKCTRKSLMILLSILTSQFLSKKWRSKKRKRQRKTRTARVGKEMLAGKSEALATM